MSRRSHGYTLIELLTTMAILGMFVSIAYPAFGNFGRRRALRAATAQLRGAFMLTRYRAISTSTNCAMKFVQLGGVWHFAVYADGDGDGVRNDDITRGVDRMLERPRVVLPESRIVTIGLLREAIKDPDGDPLPPTKSPVTFNRTTLCSFSPLGEATPGTIYLTDRGRELWCVRVFGATAKLRVLRYDLRRKRWVE